MQIHHLKRKTPNTKNPSIGRGGKRGKTSGRGTKGQDARAGRKKRPEIRDFIKKIPKLRGRGKNSFKSFAPRAIIVSLADIDAHFKSGDRVEPATIVAKGLALKTKGRFPRLKILGALEIDKKLIISGVEISSVARSAIEKAGGVVHA